MRQTKGSVAKLFFHIPADLVVESVSHSLLSSRREDLQVEEPVSCRDSPAFHFYATLPRMPGPALIGHQVVEMGQPREKRLLVSTWDGETPSSRTASARWRYGHPTGHRHLRVCEHRIPARFLPLELAPDAFPVGHSCRVRHVVGTVAEPLT